MSLPDAILKPFEKCCGDHEVLLSYNDNVNVSDVEDTLAAVKSTGREQPPDTRVRDSFTSFLGQLRRFHLVGCVVE